MKKFSTLFLLSMTICCFASHASHALDGRLSRDESKEINKKVYDLQAQYDLLSKNMFNFQGMKKSVNVGTSSKTDEFIDQIKLLRKEFEELREDINKLKLNFNQNSINVEDKMFKLENRLSKNEYDEKILNIIDNDLDISYNLESKSANHPDFIDPVKLQDEEEHYSKIIKLVEQKKYEQATKELKEFIDDNPESIINSNAYFYLGEIAYKTEDYPLAAINYIRGYQSNKYGARSLSNLVMLAKSLVKIAKYDRACKVVKFTEYTFLDIPNSMKRDLNNIKISAKCIN